MLSFSGVSFVWFCFFTSVCVLFFVSVSSFFCFLGDVAFPSIFVPLSFSLCMENTWYVVRFFLPNGVFLPCEHGLDI